jgi:3-hydroxyacyl-CoA dehydrogenase
MKTTITRVAVLGAGSMGAAIAAHCANAGLSVTLLDLTSEIVRAEFERMPRRGRPRCSASTASPPGCIR